MTTSGGWEPGGVRGFQRDVTLRPFGRPPGETGAAFKVAWRIMPVAPCIDTLCALDFSPRPLPLNLVGQFQQGLFFAIVCE